MKKPFCVVLIALLQIAIQGCRTEAPGPGVLDHPNDLRLRFFYTEEISSIPVEGRIIVGFHQELFTPINNPDPFDPQPTFALDVRDWNPGESVLLEASNATSWMGELDSLDGWYGVQAVLKTNRDARSLEARGNALTQKSVVHIEQGRMSRPLDLLFNIPLKGPGPFVEQESVKEVNLASPLLTEFYGEPRHIRAAVILPESYHADQERNYPSVYVFGGWGATHYHALAGHPQKRYGTSGFGGEKVFIVVNHECPAGYHVFCSSETNGPREETFFQELVPFIEDNYRVDKNPATRFLMGQSSGAWAGLWLLINYPDRLGGVYVASPDPVDFTDFTGTNIYQPGANMYVDARGEITHLMKSLTMRDFVGIDRIAGWGEQMYSFDASFSRRGHDGHPRHLFDWETGEVRPDVAADWKKKDLSLVVSGLDPARRERLQAKIHIYVAEDDDFGMDRPVRLFKSVLEKEGIDAEVLILAGGGHNVWSDELRTRIHGDMDGRIREAARTTREDRTRRPRAR